MSQDTKKLHDEIRREIEALSLVIQNQNMNGISDPKQQLENFKNHQARWFCLARMSSILTLYDGWDIPNLTKELKKLDDFKSKAMDTEIPFLKPITTPVTEEIIYKKFLTGYYEKHPINVNDLGVLGKYAKVYGKYFLLYNFLNEKINELYLGSKFSKLDPLQQIDEVLLVLKQNENVHGLHVDEIFMFLKNKGYLVSFRLLTQILIRLHDDKLIFMNFESCRLTFDGKMFIGYEIQRHHNQEKARIETARIKSLNYATWVAGVAGSILAVIEILKRLRPYLLTERWSALLMLVFGIALGALIPTVILATKERNDRKQNTHI